MSFGKEKKNRRKYEKSNILLSLEKIEPACEIEKEHFQGLERNIERRFRYQNRIESDDKFAIIAVKIEKNMYYVKTPYTNDEIRAMNKEEYDKLRRIIYQKFFYFNDNKEKLLNEHQHIKRYYEVFLQHRSACNNSK